MTRARFTEGLDASGARVNPRGQRDGQGNIAEFGSDGDVIATAGHAHAGRATDEADAPATAPRAATIEGSVVGSWPARE